MYYTIYRITNNVNGKTYIGKHQTSNLDDRYMGSGKLIRRAIDKYGLESFSKEILHVLGSEQEMNVKEAELVTEELCKQDNYNLCPGGHGGFGYINNNGLASRVGLIPFWNGHKLGAGPKKSEANIKAYASGRRKIVTKPQPGNSYASKSVMDPNTGIRYPSYQKAALDLGCSSANIRRRVIKGLMIGCM